MNPDTRDTRDKPALGAASGSATDSKRPFIHSDTSLGIIWIGTAALSIAVTGLMGVVGVISGFLICAYLYPKSPTPVRSAKEGRREN